MGKSKKKSAIPKNLIIILLLAIIIGGGYYYLDFYMKDPAQTTTSTNQSEYIELENNNPDKYIAIVSYNNNVNINSISTTFYKSNIFWPHIFIANKDIEGVKSNPLNIPKGVILKIPRLWNNDSDATDTAVINKAKHLADSILNTKPTL